MSMIPKDPEAVLDYAFNWADWLDTSTTPDESITAHTVTVSTGLTLDSSMVSDFVIAAEVPEDEVTIPNSLVIAWISGGTVGTTYRVECLITTSAGRKDERSLWITVQER